MIGLSSPRLLSAVRALSRLSRVVVPIGIAALGTMFAWVSFRPRLQLHALLAIRNLSEIADPGSTPRDRDPYVFFCPDVRWPSMKGQPNYRDPMRTCPDGFSPLIKPVVAWPGDTVETSAAGIVVNGQRCQTPQPSAATRQGDSFIRSRQERTAYERVNYGSSVPSVPGASIPGTSARSPCGPSTVGFAPFSSSIRTTQPPTRIDNVIRGQKAMNISETAILEADKVRWRMPSIPSSRSGPEPRFSSPALRYSVAQAGAATQVLNYLALLFPFAYLHSRRRPGLALCRLLLRCRHLERHSGRAELLSDRPTTSLCHSSSG